MKIASYLKTSLIDYPGEVSSVLFLQGCPWRCEYCHNPELVLPEQMQPRLSTDAVVRSLLNYRSKISAITITGGEPTTQPNLVKWMKLFRESGFKIKLDTNGNYPRRLEKILQEAPPDFIAMDVKTDAKSYLKLVKHRCSDSILTSISLIETSGIEHEFRTTVVEDYHLPSRMQRLFEMIPSSSPYILQGFIPSDKMVGTWRDYAATSSAYLEHTLKAAIAFGLKASLR